MNPNSGNQRWGKWTFLIYPERRFTDEFELLKLAAGAFGREQFGSASQMKVEVMRHGQILIAVRSEGHAPHDPTYNGYVKRQWATWAQLQFGHKTRLEMNVRFEAGSKQDGTPAAQLIIAPTLPPIGGGDA